MGGCLEFCCFFPVAAAFVIADLPGDFVFAVTLGGLTNFAVDVAGALAGVFVTVVAFGDAFLGVWALAFVITTGLCGGGFRNKVIGNSCRLSFLLLALSFTGALPTDAFNFDFGVWPQSLRFRVVSRLDKLLSLSMPKPFNARSIAAFVVVTANLLAISASEVEMLLLSSSILASFPTGFSTSFRPAAFVFSATSTASFPALFSLSPPVDFPK